MIRIDSVTSRSVPDSRGRATLETTVISGAHAAIELRDADGSVKRTVGNVNDIIGKAIIDREFASPDELDTLLIELDGTANKSRLGANAILSVSIAAQRLSALMDGVPLWK